MITQDGRPLLIGDVKLTGRSIDPHLYKMAQALGDIPVVQIVRESGVFKTPTPQSLVISADRFFLVFP